MKNTLYLLGCLVIILSCEKGALTNCLNTETLSIETYAINEFDTLVVGEFIKLQIVQSEDNYLKVNAYNKSLGEINLEENTSKLKLGMTNSCTFSKEQPKVNVQLFTNNLKVIYNNSSNPVFSLDTLNLDRLILYSDSNQSENSYTNGDFDLILNCNALTIASNGISQFKIKGQTNLFNVSVYGGTSKITAQNLASDQINLFYRSSLDSYLGTTNKIQGQIRSSGNVILSNTPEETEVISYYTGQLYFEN